MGLQAWAEMIDLQNVTVQLGGSTIVRSVSLSARAGEFSAVIGPSGSGKTTLLRAIAGELAYTGQIIVSGHDIAALSSRRQAGLRGVLPQASAVAFPFTVREVITLNGGHGDLPQDHTERQKAVEQLLDRVGLFGFAGRRYVELSGGEMQRVQLARVLFQLGDPDDKETPKWLLLDEPVSSLDIRHQIQILQLATAFAASGGGVIAVMHDLNLTAMFADRIFMMNSGALLAEGPTRDCMTSQNISDVFECQLHVGAVPSETVPFVLPHSAEL